MHGQFNDDKQKVKKMLRRQDDQLLSQLDVLEPVVEWFEKNYVGADHISIQVDSNDETETSLSVIDNLHDWQISPFILRKRFVWNYLSIF